MAELFTPSAEHDTLYTKMLNINGLIRELENRTGTRNLGTYYHELTCQQNPVGQLQQGNILVPKKPSDVIYDVTHDN